MQAKYRKTINILLVIMLVMSSINVSFAGISSEDVLYETIESEIVSTGLIYEKKTKLTEYGWVDIHVLKMDLTNEFVDLDILRSATEWGNKEAITTMAESSEERVVGGINGSFFDIYHNPTEIIGPEYDEDYGVISHNYNVGGNGAGSLIQAGEELFVDFFGASLSMTYGDEDRSLYIKGINTITDFSAPVIFNKVAIDNTAEIDGYGSFYKIIVEEGVVTYVSAVDESVDVPESGYVIAIGADIAEYHVPYFEIGTEVNLQVDNTLEQEDLELIISGGGKILEDGVMVESGLIIEPTKRHPRTAVGITTDGNTLIAMVVDGRGESIGATHEELANYLLEYDVENAIHMDGGGSSTMVSREFGDTEVSVSNDPSDGSQRKVANGLGFITTAPKGELYDIQLVASTDRTGLNMPVTFELIGYDEYYNPVTINEEDVFWSSQGVTGSFDGMEFTPLTAGEGQITCYYQERSSSVSLTVVNEFIDLDIYPTTVQLEQGDMTDFVIYGTDIDGYTHNVSPDNVIWEVDNELLGTFIGSDFVAGDKSGSGKITASVGDREVYAYISVGSEISTVTSFENTTVSAMSYPENITTGSAVSLEGNNAYDGNVCVALSYEMTVAKDTQAVYAVLEDVVIEHEVSKLGLNVYGDNRDLLLKGKVVDANGEAHNITFSSGIDWYGWEYVEAELPRGMAYPISLERVYVAALSMEEQLSSTIYFDLLIARTSLEVVNYDEEAPIADPLLDSSVLKNTFSISVFGQTANRNRLLDDVVLNQVYESFENDDVGIFAGNSDVEPEMVSSDMIVWENEYEIYDYDEARIMCLATDSNGLIDTDPEQWRLIQEDLVNTVQDTLIIVANESPIRDDGFSDDREAKLLHETLRDFKEKSGKAIFYINASGYESNIDYFEGIRYIDINGLWYNVPEDNELDLYNTFYCVDFHFVGQEVEYCLSNVYSKVQIQ